MESDTLKYIAKCIAQCSSTVARLYQNGSLLCRESVYHFSADPAEPYLNEMLSAESDLSIYITPLCQFYGCIHIMSEYTLVFGPSRIKNNDKAEFNKLIVDLNVPLDRQNEFRQLLECAPDIKLGRMRWMAVLYASSLNGKIYAEEDVEINSHSEELENLLQQSHEEDSAETALENAGTPDSSYEIEQLITMYVEKGQVEKLRKMFSAMPKTNVGKMATDAVRQLKNMNICAAAVFSRAAIRGGLDSKTAFRLSDIYIQQIEMMNDAVTLEKVSQELIMDFASRVCRLQCGGSANPLVMKCTTYVSEHIFERIQTSEIADWCGYSRCYLSSQFKKETGISLESYIQREKIIEAQRLLRFTDKPLCEIASVLCFSSQSHFQSVFKTITGMTPSNYRIQNS